MFYEIDVLNLGNADAKIVDLYDDNGQNYIILIDGGNPGDGKKILYNLRKYHSQNYIDLIISTHPDKDHIGGLSEVVTSIPTNAVWIHDPFKHINSRSFRLLLGGVKSQGKARRLVESFENTFEFITLIDRLKIPRIEPFDGTSFGPLSVIGPTVNYYEEMISGFKNVDSFVSNDLKGNNLIQDLLDLLAEDSSTDCVLDENNETSNENNSSVIILGLLDNKKFLFTGDAGVQALLDVSSRCQLDNIHWFDVPHHGSKHNLSMTLLNYFQPEISSISADGSKKHPSQAVVNALKIHGNVYCTHKNGNMVWYNWNNPLRSDYGPLIPL